MGIQALPQTTIRTLGATQVLTDPAAVVKELVDNALDAHASSIVVELSSNTLDSIQVRDNGHGIPPEDRLLVARPHCTSKIGSEDDLKDIGGSSLGFRGEALASVAEISGSLTITTRNEGEQVATALKIDRRGEVAGHDRASLPIGTTVKIVNFIESHPVRRQVALKAADKTLKKIKQLLQSYAFARPHVRFQLRILKAKNDKGNWMYAPKPSGNAEDAAFKIVGAACTSQCTWSVVEDQGFTLQAFLPRVDAEPSKVHNIGSFISIDRRPVASSRGAAKQLMKIFREVLKSAGSSLQGVKDLFIYVEIGCPSASYDANVEPAKDDVLFADPDTFLTVVRKLFDAVYPDQQKAVPLQSISASTQCNEHASFTAGDASVLAIPSSTHGPAAANDASVEDDQVRYDFESELQDFVPPQQVKRQGGFRYNMFGCDEEDLEFLDASLPTGRTEADLEELRQARKDISVSNPWVIAKLNASRRQPNLEQNNDPSARTASSLFVPTPDLHHRLPIDLTTTHLPTPRPSSESPSPDDVPSSSYVPAEQSVMDSRMIGSQMLPPPQPYASPRSPIHRQHPTESMSSSHREAPMYDYFPSSQTDQPAGTPLSAIPESRARPKQQRPSRINKPFVSPLHDRPPGEKVWFDHLENEGKRRLSPAKERRDRAAHHDRLVTQGELGELSDDPQPLTPPRRNRDIRDFVRSVDLTGNDASASWVESRNHAKRASPPHFGHAPSVVTDLESENATAAPSMSHNRGFVRASELVRITSGDAGDAGAMEDSESHSKKRRKTNDGRALREVDVNAVGGIDEDRANNDTMPQRRTTEGNKLSRRKSSRLPLERIPARQKTHELLFKVSTCSRTVALLANKIDIDRSLLNWNEPVMDAYDVFTTVRDRRTIIELAEKVQELLINRMSEGEVVQDLDEDISNAFAAHDTMVNEIEPA